jgi:hypothetical protein
MLNGEEVPVGQVARVHLMEEVLNMVAQEEALGDLYILMAQVQ